MMAATVRIIDMTNVQEQGEFNPKRKPFGEYVATITSVNDHTAKGKTKPDQWVFTIALDVDKRAVYPYYVGWDEKFAWKTRKLVIGAGLMKSESPKRRTKVDPARLVGKKIGIVLDDDEYEGKMKSVITDVIPATDVTATASAKASTSDDDEDLDEAADDDEDLDLEEV